MLNSERRDEIKKNLNELRRNFDDLMKFIEERKKQLEDAKSQVDDLEKRLKEFDDEPKLTAGELFPDEFILKFTSFSTLDELLTAHGIKMKADEDLGDAEEE